MLKEIQGNNMIVLCNNCHIENSYDLNGKRSKYLFEHGQYENLSFECPGCHSIESFNMNIPINDTDESFITGDLTVNEEIQRHYVRILMRMTRDDLTS